MNKLHPIQLKLLEILKANMDEPLTIRYIQELVGVSSPSVVHHHIKHLEKIGYLRRNPSNPYDYQVLMGTPEKDIAFLNVYGMAQCGPHGSILDGNPVDKIRISSKLLGFSAIDAFAVRARGNSMLPKIKSGDIVIAKRKTVAEDGDVVVCVNNGEVLIKKIQEIKHGNKQLAYNLVSFNDKTATFIANEDFKIEGVVKSVLTYSI